MTNITNIRPGVPALLIAPNPKEPQQLNPFIGPDAVETFCRIESMLELAQDLLFIERPQLGTTDVLSPRARDSMHTAFEAAKLAFRWQMARLKSAKTD